MRLFLRLLLLLGVSRCCLSAVNLESCSITCKDGDHVVQTDDWFVESNGLRYKILASPKSFEDAEISCASYGARLASTGMRDKMVRESIKKRLNEDKVMENVWIGLRLDERDWSDGFPYKAFDADWHGGQPYRGVCAGMRADWNWELDDTECKPRNYYICEQDAAPQEVFPGMPYTRDCESFKSLVSTSGPAIIFPFGENKRGMHVACNQHVDGGGWIVILRRQDGTEDFYRGWDDYVTGFGDTGSEFWLGLENIHKLTHNADYELRIDLEDYDGKKVYAKYTTFKVAGAGDHYRLHISGYSGDAGDSMKHHDNNQFSTKEYDRDGSTTEDCAKRYRGGWWYNHCHRAHLTGVYEGKSAQGVAWFTWRNNHDSIIKRGDMKIRRKKE